jgi:hypothetical protein
VGRHGRGHVLHRPGIARTTVGALSTDLAGYARYCEAKAWHLEGEADDLEARQSRADQP